MIEFIKSVSEETTLGVWRLKDSSEDPESLVLRSELKFVSDYHPKKKKEYCASRALAASMLSDLGLEYHGIVKDDHGKPYLGGHHLHLSITHNDDFVGCLINRKSSCGLDIEHPRPQLLKVQRKFLSKAEQGRYADNLDLLTKVWSTKEAIYKIYGRKQLNFAENITVLDLSDSEVIAKVQTETFSEEYVLRIEQLDESILVYST